MSEKSSNFAPAKVCADKMLVSEVIGQTAVKTRMLESLQAGRIAHAQLLTGPAGVGKLALALAYAQLVSCVKGRKETPRVRPLPRIPLASIHLGWAM